MGGRTTNLTKTPFLVLFVILISASIGTASLVNAQLETVPDWFRGVAGFWAEEKISTSEFLDGIEFLIGQEIIQVPGYVPTADAQSINQTSIDELWSTIADLQNRVDNIEQNPNTEDPQLSFYIKKVRLPLEGTTTRTIQCDSGDHVTGFFSGSDVIDSDHHVSTSVSPDGNIAGFTIFPSKAKFADIGIICADTKEMVFRLGK